MGRLLYGHNGLILSGQRVNPFSVDIPRDRWAKAIASGNVDRFFARELQRRLGLAQLPADFWYVLEISPTGIPHMHGAAVVPEEGDAAFRDALRQAVGEWDRCRQFQAFTKDACNFGWVSYDMGEFGQHGIPGRGYYITRPALQREIAAYEARREAARATPATS